MSDFALASPRIRSDPCHAMSPVTNNVTANPTDNFLSITVDLLTHTALDTAAMLIYPTEISTPVSQPSSVTTYIRRKRLGLPQRERLVSVGLRRAAVETGA